MSKLLLRHERLMQPLNDSLDDLIVVAFRYYCGRRTAAACGFAHELARAWHELDTPQQDIIRRELHAKIAQDDTAREYRNFSPHPLGDDCDRRAWVELARVIEEHANS